MRPHAALSLALLLAPLPAQTRLPGPPPVHVEVTADATALQTAGTATLRIRFVCDEPLERAYAVRIELRRGGRELLRRDHAPPVPSRKWAKGKGVEYDLPCAFRLPPATLKAGDRIEVWLGLLDEAALDDQNRVVAVASPKAGPDRMARVAEFVFAALGATPDAAAIDALIAAALPLAAKQPGAAWDQLEFAFRRLDDYPLKAKLQKALLQVGRMPAPTPTFEEQAIVQARIRDERARYLRIVAGRMNDRGRLLGALLLLDEVGGALQEDADRAVLGALDAAQRATKDREGLAAKIFAPTKEQEAELAELSSRIPATAERIEHGSRLGKDRARRAVGRSLIASVEGFPDLRQRAIAAREAIEKEWLADVPPEERAEAEAAMNHPCWARTSSRASHRFLILGPKQLIEDIPDDSLLRFDLAYLYLTDLFGRLTNPIARASQVMAELSALAASRAARPLAAE